MPLAAMLHQCGPADLSVQLTDEPDPGAPGPGEIVVDMRLAPINPADLLIIAGNYGAVTDLPARLGAEGTGIVTQAGAATHFTPGDAVLPLLRGSWSQRLRLPAHAVVPVPPGLSLTQAATLRINPATARRLLTTVPLQNGDFVIQNAGGSMVGRCVAILVRALGLQCCSIVRNLGAVTAAPGEIIVQDSEDLPARVMAATGGAPIRLALDCVAGAASGRLAACLAHGGTLMAYGHLSGSPCEIPSTLLTARGLTIRGFSLRPAEAASTQAELAAFYRELAHDLHDFTPPIEATYKLRDLHAALRHAAAPGHHGKILLDLT
jgi:NADPH:quinone reductase-like Zn-dependent oxidoreductase